MLEDARASLETVRLLSLRGHISAHVKSVIKHVLLGLASHTTARDAILHVLAEARRTKFYYGAARALEHLLKSHEMALGYDAMRALSGPLDAATRTDLHALIQKQANAAVASAPAASVTKKPALSAAGTPRTRATAASVHGRTFEAVQAALIAGTYSNVNDLFTDMAHCTELRQGAPR